MCRLSAYACFLLIFLVRGGTAQQAKHDEPVRERLAQHEYDLSGDGKVFLSDEARRASFFLLGELHGENEIPALLRGLWPGMWRDGYRYVAAELSPWAANQLEFTPTDRQVKLVSLWTKQEAHFFHSLSGGPAGPAVLWGCDMEEMQPQLLIRDLAAANPANTGLARMLDITRSGYKREMAPELLQLARGLTTTRDVSSDVSVNDTSLLGNLEATLEIESARLNADTKREAQLRRESLMKELFLLHYQKSMSSNPEAKVMLRFGRNHLHRGYDGRGISTLGNFVAEFALAQHKTVFNVAAFGAGGKASLAGETWDADERGDDVALALLASLARYPATVFDLRPLRQTLHSIPDENRSPVEQRLVYWADSYDAIICYRNVTPLNP
ncbi:MAG TPA: hypothetical protein VKR59_07450 [Terriglobales bacterium]|nr:hypothetical protein [Terriglobales bacterium]